MPTSLTHHDALRIRCETVTMVTNMSDFVSWIDELSKLRYPLMAIKHGRGILHETLRHQETLDR